MFLRLFCVVRERRAGGRHLITLAMNEDGDQLVDRQVEAAHPVRREMLYMSPVVLHEDETCVVCQWMIMSFSEMKQTEVRLRDHLPHVHLVDIDIFQPKHSVRGVVHEVILAGVLCLGRIQVQLRRVRDCDVLLFHCFANDGDEVKDLLLDGLGIHVRIGDDVRLYITRKIELSFGLDMSRPSQGKIRGAVVRV